MKRGFTLIEIIIVIIIVGILAAVGLTQYSTIVEKGRFAEAKVRVGTITKLAYEYYLNNGTFVDITNEDLGVDATCHSTDYYRYNVVGLASYINLYAYRCTSEGKAPQGVDYRLLWRLNSSGLLIQRAYYNSDGAGWIYTDNWGACCR